MDAKDDKVVFLAFSNAEAPSREISIAVTSCKACSNKTFIIKHDVPDDFPMIECACCGNSVGRMGWAP